MSSRSDLRPETLAVSLGRPPRTPGAPLNVAPVMASTYVGAHDTSTSGTLGYGRDGNDTWTALEDVLGALGGGRALTFASGMAAASAVLEQLAPGGTIVLPSSCYLGVAALVADPGREVRLDRPDGRRRRHRGRARGRRRCRPRLAGVADQPADGGRRPARDRRRAPRPGPYGRRQHLRERARAAPARARLRRRRGVGDQVRRRPLRPAARRPDRAPTRTPTTCSRTSPAVRHDSGAIPGTMEAWLALRGVRTMPLRVRAAQASAGTLAGRLAGHPAVGRVRYPGLPGDPGHARAASTMDGFGSLLSVDLADARPPSASSTAARCGPTPRASAASSRPSSAADAGPPSCPSSPRASSACRSASSTSRTSGSTSSSPSASCSTLGWRGGRAAPQPEDVPHTAALSVDGSGGSPGAAHATTRSAAAPVRMVAKRRRARDTRRRTGWSGTDDGLSARGQARDPSGP